MKYTKIDLIIVNKCGIQATYIFLQFQIGQTANYTFPLNNYGYMSRLLRKQFLWKVMLTILLQFTIVGMSVAVCLL